MSEPAYTGSIPSTSNTGNSENKPQPQLPQLNANCLAQVEKEARSIANDYYKLSKQLQLQLNHISAASVCCIQTYQESVSKLCDNIDDCIKQEDVLLKKTNELSKCMEPVYKLQTKINSIKTILTTLETQI